MLMTLITPWTCGQAADQPQLCLGSSAGGCAERLGTAGSRVRAQGGLGVLPLLPCLWRKSAWGRTVGALASLREKLKLG